DLLEVDGIGGALVEARVAIELDGIRDELLSIVVRVLMAVRRVRLPIGKLADEVGVQWARSAFVDLGPQVQDPQLFSRFTRKLGDCGFSSAARELAAIIGFERLCAKLDLSGPGRAWYPQKCGNGRGSDPSLHVSPACRRS